MSTARGEAVIAPTMVGYLGASGEPSPPWEMGSIALALFPSRRLVPKGFAQILTEYFTRRGWEPVSYCPLYRGSAKRRVGCKSCARSRSCGLQGEWTQRREEFRRRHLTLTTDHPLRIHTDAGPHSHGVRVGFMYKGAKEVMVVVDYPFLFTTSLHAEAWAIYHALSFLREGSQAVLTSDSKTHVNALNMATKRESPELRGWVESTYRLMHHRGLRVRFEWAPRGQNGAGRGLWAVGRLPPDGCVCHIRAGSCSIAFTYRPTKVDEFLTWMNVVREGLLETTRR